MLVVGSFAATCLFAGVVGEARGDDPATSVTVTLSHLRGDGCGVNLGVDKQHATSTVGTSRGRVKRM